MTVRTSTLFVLLLVCLAGFTSASASETGDSDPETASDELGLALRFAFGLYRSFVSPQDIASCGFSPSCSHFAQEAVNQHGVQGLLMTSDRLQRCNDCSANLYRRDTSSGLGLDLVSDNVLWGKRKPVEPTASAPPRPSTTGLLRRQDAGKVTSANRDVSYYRLSSLIEFAQHLSVQGDFRRAAGEYERILFLMPEEDPRRNETRFLVGKNLRCAGAPDLAESHLEAMLESPPLSGNLHAAILRQLALCDLDRGLYARARARVAGQYGPGSQSITATDITGGSYLLEGRWEKAESVLRAAREENPGAPRELVSALRDLALEGLESRRKSEAVAGLMSSLVPGTGKIYAGRTSDGLFSLLSIAFCTWQAIDGFEQDGRDSVKGWIFGSFAGSWYAGNIYGSVLAARIHNRNIRLELNRQGRALMAGVACEY